MTTATLLVPRTGEWLEAPGFGVYVHIPFCRHRCHYCDFNTYEGQEDLFGAYVEALIADIARWGDQGRVATSVYFGGGTPTLLGAHALRRILEAVRARTGLAPGAEVTVEANPETVDEREFELLQAAGFNRFSIGVQSLVPEVLRALGRTHSAGRALEAVRAARRAGCDDINVDLIYGSPWESASDWDASLDGVLEADPTHVSAYALTVEEGTPLATLVATGRVPDVDPDVQADRFAVAEARLGAAGFARYEVSNWAQAGHASHHNVLYWSAGDYLGFGAGAHAHLDGHRWWCTRLVRDFVGALERGESTVAGEERLEGDARAAEALVLGLRLASGVDPDAFARRFGRAPLERRAGAIRDLAARGLLERRAGRLRLVPEATFVANEVACALL